MRFNAKQKVLILGLAGILPVINNVASFADIYSDGSTATIEVVAVDPLDQYRGLTDLTDKQLVDLLSQVGFKGKSLKLAWAIVMRESRGHPTSRNNNSTTGDNSYGLFQINMIGYLGEARREKFGITKNSDLFDPVVNAQAAFYMSAKGTNFGSWGYGPDAYDGSPEEPSITVWLDKFPG